MTNILDYDETKHWLNYITESPDREHGGFHGITIDTARSALFYMDKFETELAALRERTRRISVQERPPEHEDTVIAFTDGDYPEISIFYNGKFTFRDYGYSSEIQRVTHWQPLPDGPEVKP